ncbi:hypothetical protein EDB19DRAFT_1639416 [Suillus lakei]|nr:hypothetical protein EDB19DRAFT_1639416 [Suillus lakei]
MESKPCSIIDAYAKGLNGTQVAWAIKKYCGHHVLLESIMKEFDDFHPSESLTSV